MCRRERARGERPPPNLAPGPQGSGALLFSDTRDVPHAKGAKVAKEMVWESLSTRLHLRIGETSARLWLVAPLRRFH